MKKRFLAASIAAIAGLGLSGQAMASLHAASSLETSDFVITIDALASVESFNFRTTSTAALESGAVDDADISQDSCFSNGTPVATNNNCGSGGVAGSGNEVLNSGAANVVQAGSPLRDDATFTLFGPGGNEYANALGVIEFAEVPSGGVDATQTKQIAESELQTDDTGSAGSSSLITSTTNLSVTFVSMGGGLVTIDFDALPYQISEIVDPDAPASGPLVSSDMSVTFNLVQDEEGNGDPGDGNWGWSSDGSNNNNCSGNLGCNETDPFNLNDGTTAGADGSTDERNAALSTFSFTAGTAIALDPGLWTLTLTLETSTNMSRTEPAVPAPGALALLGIGLAGMGAMRRRQKKSG